jgi:uncharacterized protein with von Willebrand factor type A (vWA) domain
MEEENICYHKGEPSSINLSQQYQENEPSPISWHHQSYSFLRHSEANMRLLEYIGKLEAQEKASPIYQSQQYEEEPSSIYWPQQYHEEPPPL